MKTVGLVLSMMSTSLAQAQSEHGALLQILSEHVKLSSSVGSALDKTQELRTHLLAIAQDHKGKHLADNITQYLKDIRGLVNSTKLELKSSHDAAVETEESLFNAILAANAEVDDPRGVGPNKNLPSNGQSVTAALANATASRAAHCACRMEEVKLRAKAIGEVVGSCTTFKTSLESALQCQVTPLTGKVAEPQRLLDIWTATNATLNEKYKCETDLNAYTTQNAACTEKQTKAEQATCHAHMKSVTVCGKLDKDYAEAKAAYNTNCENLILPRDTRQSQALVTESILCMVDHLLADNILVDDLAACEVTENATITDPLYYECKAVPEKTSCDWPEDYYVAPGPLTEEPDGGFTILQKKTDPWFMEHIGGKPWYDKATNNIELQIKIPGTTHQCDLQPLNEYSAQFSAEKNAPLA